MEDTQKQFEKIYTDILSIEDYADEDDILRYTLQVYFNSVWESEPSEKIEEKLQEAEDPIPFIKEFIQDLIKNFESACTFYLEDEQERMEIHSFIQLGEIYGDEIDKVMPFVIKAYKFGLPIDQISQLCKSLESLVLRHKLTKTRADFLGRIGWLFEGFYTENKDTGWIDVERIIEDINSLKKDESDDYWSNDKLKKSFKDKKYKIDDSIAKFVLWKYENYLLKSGQKDYELMRFDDDKIEDPELEHIAPKTESGEPEAGYPKYTEEFQEKYLNCWGNYLLISGSHNSSIGNKPFAVKLKSYNGPNSLAQQRKVVEMVGDTPKPKWTKELIDERHWKIVEFILKEL